jgi:hypothetical protein
MAVTAYMRRRNIDRLDAVSPRIHKQHGALITYLKRRAVFRPRLALIIEPGRSDIRVPQPLLNLGDVCLVIKRVRGCRRSVGRQLLFPVSDNYFSRRVASL